VRQFAIIANVADSVRGWREWQFEVTFSLQIKAVRRGLSRNHYRIPPRNTCADTLGYPWDRIKKKKMSLETMGSRGREYACVTVNTRQCLLSKSTHVRRESWCCAAKPALYPTAALQSKVLRLIKKSTACSASRARFEKKKRETH